MGYWDLLLPAIGAAGVGAAVWMGTRVVTRSLSQDARKARAARRRLDALARSTLLRVDPAHSTLHGRVDGWAVEVRREWRALRTGEVPTEHWRVRLFADSTESDATRGLPLAPAPLAPVSRDGPQLVASLPIADEALLPQQLSFMARAASTLHATPDPSVATSDPLAETCRGLGLHADTTLPRWSGRSRGRSLLVERWVDAGVLHVHLGLKVELPPGLWVGNRDHWGTSGVPVPLPLHMSSSALSATAVQGGVGAAKELLDNPQLIEALAAHIADGRGSRVYAGAVVLVRSAMAFSVAPGPILDAAEAVAQALEAAVERPWRTLATTHALTASTDRAGGFPVLRGTRDGFDLELRRGEGGDGTRVQATPSRVTLARGLRIEAGKGRGTPTTNPILDGHLSVHIDEAVPVDELAALPAESLLPLMLEEAHAEVTDRGVVVVVAGHPSVETLSAVLADLERLLPALPRSRVTSA